MTNTRACRARKCRPSTAVTERHPRLLMGSAAISVRWLIGLTAVLLVAVLVSAPGASATGSAHGAGQPAASGHELPAGPLSTLDAINDRGVVAGTDTLGHAATWNPATNRVIDLGLLPESYGSQALALNNRGDAAGVSRARLDASYDMRAFRWTSRGGMADLGTLGGRFSTAAAINNRGNVVGYSNLADCQTSHAFLWTPRRGMLDLGTLPGTTSSVATDINDRDQVVGYSYALISDSTGQHQVTHGFQWTSRGGMTDLGTLGGDDVQAAAVNDRGVVAGTSTTADGSRHVFTWTRRTGIRDLGTMGEQNITVRGLTNTGVITGFRQVGPSPDPTRAYLFTPRNGFQDLGLPTSDLGTSFANAMNNELRIVGSVRDGDLNTPYRNFIWQVGHGR